MTEVAAKQQQQAIQEAGKGKPTVTASLRLLHEFIIDRLEELGDDWATKISYREVSTFCQLGERMLNFGRVQDPFGHLADTEEFVDGNDFTDATKIGVRIYDTKDVKGASRGMNAHSRPCHQQQQGKLASEAIWQRPSSDGPLKKPPYFKLFAVMYAKRRMMKIVHGLDEPIKVTVSNSSVTTTRLYRTERGTPQTAKSMSAECLKVLKKSKAMPEGSNLKTTHMRHTTLSYVNHYDHNRLREALLRSRHESKTFRSTYDFRVDKVSRDALAKLPSHALLEDIAMG
jgi:hypothetical protein